ncbi:MAG: DUF6414 family protein [Firmicutes bacterium]|nr:DUF6414 family protein [Bacillota bacterium]
MAENSINKIIYFDKETIRNILQERNHGKSLKETSISSSTQGQASASAEVSAKLKLEVPIMSRLQFLFTGKIDASYVIKRDSTTTISSTEISEFEKLKSSLAEIPNVQLYDIENSSTSLRVAGGYLKIVKGGVDGLDTNEFKTVMDSYDGYDTYLVDDGCYVRFNNSAFVSNYKRNDLLTTRMTLYCISVGEFDKTRFDFVQEISKMERLVSTTNKQQTLADIHPSTIEVTENKTKMDGAQKSKDKVVLYDVLYACVTADAKNGEATK